MHLMRSIRQITTMRTGLGDHDEWRDRAQCLGDDPNNYSLERREHHKTDRQATARDLCRGCPVMSDCATDALEPLAYSTVRGGVWIPSPSAGYAPHVIGWVGLLKALKWIASGAVDADDLMLMTDDLKRKSRARAERRPSPPVQQQGARTAAGGARG